MAPGNRGQPGNRVIGDSPRLFSAIAIVPKSRFMKPFWIRLDWSKHTDVPYGTRLGVGVTADSIEAALNIIRSDVMHGVNLPTIVDWVEVQSLSQLDQRHVVPNMGSLLEGGVWFPLGYR